MRPSDFARWTRWFALSTAAGCAGILTAAFAIEPSAPRAIAGAIALAAIVLAWRRGRSVRLGAVSVDPRGNVRWRAHGAAPVLRATPVLATASLVMLRTTSGRHLIWADALSGTAWRRLVVAARWCRTGSEGQRNADDASSAREAN